MPSEVVSKPCNHVACKCQTTEGSCCSEFCRNVETSEDNQRCGCGHTACDTTKEIGNESTFASTGS